MSWGPWTHYTAAMPEPGDYIRVKCGCYGHYHEGIYLGTNISEEHAYGTINMAPRPGPDLWFCYWSRKEHGDLSEEKTEVEKTIEELV